MYTAYDINELEAVEQDFLGMGKKARANRAEKKDQKNARKTGRINARADGRAKVAGSGGGFLNRAGKGLMSTAQTIFGGGSAPTLESVDIDQGGLKADFADPKADEEKTNYTPWIIGGVVVALIITVVVIKMRKKR